MHGRALLRFCFWLPAYHLLRPLPRQVKIVKLTMLTTTEIQRRKMKEHEKTSWNILKRSKNRRPPENSAECSNRFYTSIRIVSSQDMSRLVACCACRATVLGPGSQPPNPRNPLAAGISQGSVPVPRVTVQDGNVLPMAICHAATFFVDCWVCL